MGLVWGYPGVGTHVVDEPEQAHDGETGAVEAQDQAVGGVGVPQRVFLEAVGFLLALAEPHDEQQAWEDGADAEADAPDCVEVLVVASLGYDPGEKGTTDETLLFC